jgi:hypothetical protein
MHFHWDAIKKNSYGLHTKVMWYKHLYMPCKSKWHSFTRPSCKFKCKTNYLSSSCVNASEKITYMIGKFLQLLGFTQLICVYLHWHTTLVGIHFPICWHLWEYDWVLKHSYLFSLSCLSFSCEPKARATIITF